MGIDDLLVDNLDEFRKKCLKRERRTTIAYFGLDLIIDKKGKIHCIEINGKHSGTAGEFGEKIRKKFVSYLASFGVPVEIFQNDLYYETPGHEDGWAKEFGVRGTNITSFQLECSKRAMGNDSMSNEEYFSRKRKMKPEVLERLNSRYRKYFFQRTKEVLVAKPEMGIYDIREAKGIIWDNNHISRIIDENNYLSVNPFIIEWLTEDKLAQAQMVHFIPTYYNKSLEDIPKNKHLHAYIKNKKVNKVVLKPVKGKCGTGVIVLEKKDLGNKFSSLLENPEKYLDDERSKVITELKYSGEVIVNPLIESKPFYSPLTGKNHRSCIRYLVAVHSENGNIHPYPLGGFSRLSAEPISDCLYSYVANMAKGAHSASIEKSDEKRIVKWVDSFIKTFYRRALRLDVDAGPIVNAVWAFDKPEIYKMPWIWY